MSRYFDRGEASKIIEISGQLSVILIDRLGQEDAYGSIECAKNIILIDGGGNVVWQVSSDFDSDGGAFTNVNYAEGKLQGYRWDGGMYDIDLKTGKANPVLLVK